MAPPLRNPEDVAAVREGIADGTLDAIATDHAPHSSEEKARPFVKTPNGIIGLETAVPLIITEFVRKGMMTPVRMAELMSLNPSRLIGHFGGTLGIGAEADVTIIDPEYEYTIDPSGFASKSRNTPYAGRKVFGKVMYTIVGGHIAYEERTKA
jgi:dihydroorotase